MQLEYCYWSASSCIGRCFLGDREKAFSMPIPFILMSFLFIGGIIIALRAIVQNKSPWKTRLYAFIAVSGLLVFIVCADLWMAGQAIAQAHGGYSYLGKVEDGRYLVANKGTYTEVTAEQWKFLQKMERILGGWWYEIGSVGMAVFVVMGILLPKWRNWRTRLPPNSAEKPTNVSSGKARED